MKFRIFYFLLFILPIVNVQAQSILSACRLIGYTECESRPTSCNNLTLFEPENDHFVEVASLQPEPNLKFSINNIYSLAPNQTRIAVEEVSAEDPLPLENFLWLIVYDVQDHGFEYVTGIPDALLAKGSIWSSDSNKLLFWDAWGNYLLSMYDILPDERTELWPAPPIRSIRAFGVSWSPNGEQIAVFGDEHPFPTSQHALNDVTALYIAQPIAKSTIYTAISDPEYDAGWYFDRAEWISNDQIAFTEYASDASNSGAPGRLKISEASGEVVTSIEGNYNILGRVFQSSLLVGQTVSSTNYRVLAFDLTTKELTPRIVLTIDEFTPFPYFTVSPDSHYIGYFDGTGEHYSIYNLENNSVTEFTAPVIEDTGWWTPDSNALLFFDYAGNSVHRYDLATKTLSEIPAAELFPEYAALPLYPNWICGDD